MKQIIKQPNGEFAIFSTLINQFLIVNATQEQVVDYMIKSKIKDYTNELNNIIKKISYNVPVYYKQSVNFETAIELDRCSRIKHNMTIPVEISQLQSRTIQT